jgi:hypothetical protein
MRFITIMGLHMHSILDTDGIQTMEFIGLIMCKVIPSFGLIIKMDNLILLSGTLTITDIKEQIVLIASTWDQVYRFQM